MNTIELVPRPDMAPSLSRRALDLARDEMVSTTDGSAHLVRLAMGRLEALEAARRELDRLPATPDVVCAHLLLAGAINAVERPR
jgi:hypothetical protein